MESQTTCATCTFNAHQRLKCILAVIALCFIILQLRLIHLCVLSTGDCVGRKPGRDRTQVLPGDGASPGHADPAGGRAVPAASGHATQQDRLRATATHQAKPGDGDRHLQEAAGRRGNVSARLSQTEGF